MTCVSPQTPIAEMTFCAGSDGVEPAQDVISARIIAPLGLVETRVASGERPKAGVQVNRAERAQRQELQDAQALFEALEATDLGALGAGWGVRRGFFTEAYGLERIRIGGLWNGSIGRAVWLGFAGYERRIGAVIDGAMEVRDEAFGITTPIMAQILVRLAAARW